MKWVWWSLVLVSCSKGDAVHTTAKAGSSAVSADVFANAKGVVVTANDVRVDGKSLGILPKRLVTDRDALKAAVGQSLLANGSAALALAYTDDAAGDAALGALRGLGERVARPRAEPMALDESKTGGTGTAMGEGHATPDADAPAIRVTAIVAGTPTEVCRVLVPPSTDPDDERVELTLQIGHTQWIRNLTRVKPEPATIAANAHDLDRELRAQKATPFFSDRDDIELAAAPDASGADLTPVLATSCGAGFRTVQPLSLAELTALLGQK